MNKIKENFGAALVLIGVAVVAGLFFGVGFRTTNSLGGGNSVNLYDTTSAGFTVSTSTVNTTSTQMFALVNKVSYLTNNTTSTFTCSLDARNSTAASSTVTAGRGVLIGSASSSMNGTLPGVVAFGNCDNLGVACFRHTGAVNCSANAAATIDKIVQ